MARKWIFSLVLAAPLWVDASSSLPVHGLEIQGFGKQVGVDAISQFSMRGRKLRMNGQEVHSTGDWLSGIQRVYSLAEGQALIIVGKEEDPSYYDLTGTHLLRMHETGVALTRNLSQFSTLGWPQQNPDLRVFPEISAVLSSSTGALRTYRLGAYATAGLLLVSPDGQRAVSQNTNGAILVYGADAQLQAMLWPDAQVVAEAKQQRWNETKRILALGRMFDKAQRGLIEPYATYQWAQQSFSWYRKDGQWHLQGLGLSSEAEPGNSDVGEHIGRSYEHLISTGNPLPWRNFHTGRLGDRDGSGQVGLLPTLPTSFDFIRPLSILGISVNGADMPSLQLRLFSAQSVAEVEAGLTRFFSARGMQVTRVNEVYLRILGGAQPLFAFLQPAKSPYSSALTVTRYAGHGCGECADE